VYIITLVIGFYLGEAFFRHSFIRSQVKIKGFVEVYLEAMFSTQNN